MAKQIDPKVTNIIHHLASQGVQHIVEGLSGMIGEPLIATPPEIRFLPVLQIPNQFGGPEVEAVGIYLHAEGQMAGQFMLILPLDKALELVDLLMMEPPGTTTSLEGIGKSALAEVGNLAGSYFLNAIADITHQITVVTPPAVMSDMVGAILNVIVAESASQVEEVVTIITSLIHGGRDVQATFWYVPDANTLDALAQLQG
ncbi:MAG TPA: hypothetical protein VIO61_14565 [Anaerolineaceae bacterium]